MSSTSTIGGLLNAEQDLQLLHLSLHETKTHTILTHTAFHTPPTTPTTPSSPNHTLYVPHLHFPWATTLCETLHRTLRIRLHPLNTTPPHIIPTNPQTFYPQLPIPQHSSNFRTLTAIHQTHPGILPRLSIFVKLAYCNNLLYSLNRLLTTTNISLSRTTPQPQPPTKAIPTAPRPGAAESGRVVRLVQTSFHNPRNSPQLPPPPPHNPSTLVRISAHSLPNHRGAPSAFLLHGVSVPAFLLPTTISLLRTYAILVETHSPEPPATLANLSFPSFRNDRRPVPGRGPRMVDDPVDKFVLRAYAIPWPRFCTAIVAEARRLVETQRLTELRQEVCRLERAVSQCHTLRKSLVKEAIAKEVAGSSLANMCAFAIAQSDQGQFESDFARFARDSVRQVGDARHRIWQLSTEETRSVAVLVAGMRDAP